MHDYIFGSCHLEEGITIDPKKVEYIIKSLLDCRLLIVNKLLTGSPIFSIVDPQNDFMVCTNAYNESLGEVLMQEGYAILYESRKIKEHEKNYATYDLELAAHCTFLQDMKTLVVKKKI